MDRPLDRAGELQAVDIAQLLKGRDVSRLLASPTTRCRDTLSGLSVATDRAVEDAPGSGVDATGETVLSLLAHSESSSVVACTHGEVMEQILDVLRSRDWSIAGPNEGDVMCAGVVRRLDADERMVDVHSDAVEDCGERGASWW